MTDNTCINTDRHIHTDRQIHRHIDYNTLQTAFRYPGMSAPPNYKITISGLLH